MTRGASFWDRRRAAVRAEAEAEEHARREAEVAAEQATLAEKTDEEILAELDLPDPDSLQMGDDFTRFMVRKVPQHIRQRALRRLWRSNPVLACVDGLNDYDDDYLTGSTGNGPLQTTYQVGKGLAAHLLELERQARETAAALDGGTDTEEPRPSPLADAPAEVASAAASGTASDTPSEAAPEPATDAPLDKRNVSLNDGPVAQAPVTAAAPEAATAETVAETQPVPRPARRMAFHFDGETA